MTQAKVRFASFEDYLTWSNAPENYLEGRYELIDGELVELPTESELNGAIAVYILAQLLAVGFLSRLLRPYQCEIQVSVLERGDAQTRLPDLTVLREEHLDLLKQRTTITLKMPPPRMIVEVASPGKRNQERDYSRKSAQYEAIGVDEYWIADPTRDCVTVFTLDEGKYLKREYQGKDIVPCSTCSALNLTAEQILSGG
ncbi:MAG: Uma2 family endonuclease [Oculatellaceae cyanobacterium Prado106]|jgi:Uma2 family endonuclease|nr:Uma2 family endonuclease [Oculatellaceae cyanobacterium Prado106]